MKRDDVIRILTRYRREIVQDHAVSSILLFGSVARDQATTDSDVDLLAAFEHPPGFDGYMSLKFLLEGLLGCRVDLVMDGALTPEARPLVEQEAIRVA